MSALQERNAALLSELGETSHPGSRSIRMIGYLRDARKDQQITLYEHYLVEAERLSFERSRICFRNETYFDRQEEKTWQSSA